MAQRLARVYRNLATLGRERDVSRVALEELRVVSWGVIPLLSVAAAQYPQIASFVFRTLSPFSGLLH